MSVLILVAYLKFTLGRLDSSLIGRVPPPPPPPLSPSRPLPFETFKCSNVRDSWLFFLQKHHAGFAGVLSKRDSFVFFTQTTCRIFRHVFFDNALLKWSDFGHSVIWSLKVGELLGIRTLYIKRLGFNFLLWLSNYNFGPKILDRQIKFSAEILAHVAWSNLQFSSGQKVIFCTYWKLFSVVWKWFRYCFWALRGRLLPLFAAESRIDEL